MTNELATVDRNSDLIQFDDSKVELIRRTIAQGATDDELELFLHQCRRTGLDPLAKQIYFQKYKTKRGPQMTIITGIDGYRLIADRTGVYAGNDDAVFEGRGTGRAYDGEYAHPHKASVTVWKIVAGKRVPFTASAYWNEYYPGDDGRGTMWRKMPHVMLSKVAEALALRKAFPADLSGMYTRDEMDQANADWQELEAPKASKSPRNVDTDTGEITEGTVTELPVTDELPPSASGTNGTDARAETAPAAQRERAEHRPTAPKPKAKQGNGNGIDWKARAMGKDFTAFASCLINADVGYENDNHIENALGTMGEEFSKGDTERLWDMLVERKAETA